MVGVLSKNYNNKSKMMLFARSFESLFRLVMAKISDV
jgi:hypothetical protein